MTAAITSATLLDLSWGEFNGVNLIKHVASSCTTFSCVLANESNTACTDEGESWWLDVCNVTPQELGLLAQYFGLHALTVEDILAPDTREKVDIFKNYLFVSYYASNLQMDDSQDGWMTSVPVYCVITPTGLLSFHTRPIGHVSMVLDRLFVQNDSALIVTPEWYCYALLDAITDEYLQIASQIEYAVEAVDELSMVLDASEREEMLTRITTTRKAVTVAQHHLFAKPDVLRALVKRVYGSKQADEVALYLGDVLDHALSASQQVASCDATLRRAHSNYLAHLSVHIATSSGKLGDLMGKWTVFGSILVPLTILSGLFGMNVYVPGKDPGDGSMDLTWWWGILGGSAAYVLVVLMWARLTAIL